MKRNEMTMIVVAVSAKDSMSFPRCIARASRNIMAVTKRNIVQASSDTVCVMPKISDGVDSQKASAKKHSLRRAGVNPPSPIFDVSQ